MPLSNQVHVDRPLTMMSVAFMAAQSPVAFKLFPLVPVEKQSDIYFEYDEGDFNRADANIRAPGAAPDYGDYDIGTANPYFCKNYEKSKLVTDEERSNSDSPLAPDQDALVFCTQVLAMTLEKNFAEAAFNTSVWGADKAGGTDFTQWDNPLSDPAADVTAWKRVVQNATCGYMPNVLAIAGDVYDKLKVHPKVLESIKYTQPGFSGDVTPALLAQFFGIEEVVIADVVRVTSAKGVTPVVKANIYSKKVLLVYRTKTPSLRSPTAGITPAWNASGFGADAKGMVVRRWRNDERMGDSFQVMSFLDFKVVSSECGVYAYDVIS